MQRHGNDEGARFQNINAPDSVLDCLGEVDY